MTPRRHHVGHRGRITVDAGGGGHIAIDVGRGRGRVTVDAGGGRVAVILVVVVSLLALVVVASSLTLVVGWW